MTWPLLLNPFAALFLLILVIAILAGLWLDQASIAASAIQNVPFEVEFHAYMIGLFIPEGFLIGLIWNPGLQRYTSPLSGRIMSGGTGLILSALYALFGFFIFRPWLESQLTGWLTSWAESGFWSLLGYWLYVVFALLFLPLLVIALAFPGGAVRGLRWLARALW